MFKKCRIVLVDDHEAIRKALCNLLSLYEDMQIVGEAADGKEAIDIVSSCRPDVVVMDSNMPRMNGLEAANLMKKSWEETLIIGLCTVQDTYTTDAFLRAGASAVVSKNRIADLYPTIQRACENTVEPSR